MTARLMPLWIAHEQGIFAKYGIDAQPILIRGAPTLVAGLASGDIHIGRTGGSAMLAAVAGGHDFKFIASFSSRNTYDLVVRPNIKRAEDLRANDLPSPASAALHGWGFFCGLSTSASISSAIRFKCRWSAIKGSRHRRLRMVSAMQPFSMAHSAASSSKKA